MQGFTVRVATPDDEAAVRDLLRASYPEQMASSYDDAVLAAAMPLFTAANPRLLASGTYYLAESTSGDPVGCGGWTLERPDTGEVEPGLAHIRHFGTHAAWTGRGIGRAIYARCEAAARSAGARRFECYSSLNGEGFYAALGFRPVRPFDVAMAPGVSVPGVLMERAI